MLRLDDFSRISWMPKLARSLKGMACRGDGPVAALSIWGASFHGAFAVDWASAGMADRYLRFYRCSSGGAVRDSRSISAGHWTLGAR